MEESKDKRASRRNRYKEKSKIITTSDELIAQYQDKRRWSYAKFKGACSGKFAKEIQEFNKKLVDPVTPKRVKQDISLNNADDFFNQLLNKDTKDMTYVV